LGQLDESTTALRNQQEMKSKLWTVKRSPVGASSAAIEDPPDGGPVENYTGNKKISSHQKLNAIR